MSSFTDILAIAIASIFAQNLVLNGGYGLSFSINNMRRGRSALILAGVVTIYSLLVTMACWPLGELFTRMHWKTEFLNFLFPLILCLIYLIVAIIVRYFVSQPFIPATLKLVRMGALNSAVLAIPFFVRKLAYSFGQSVVYSIGAGIAVYIAMVLIAEGVKICNNPYVPKSFQGLPITLLYISLLALALMGLKGFRLFI